MYETEVDPNSITEQDISLRKEFVALHRDTNDKDFWFLMKRLYYKPKNICLKLNIPRVVLFKKGEAIMTVSVADRFKESQCHIRVEKRKEKLTLTQIRNFLYPN